jgi:hypothetical protein
MMGVGSGWVVRLAAIVALSLGACAKGATTLDEDAHQPNPGSSDDDGDDESPCGNDRIDEGEDCDGALLDGVTCINLGFTGGQLSCDPVTCMFETGACTRPANLGGGGADG